MRELRVEDTSYPVLRHLTLPVVAVTSSAGGRTNGMIANSAQRASLVPSLPRVSLYVSKPNYSHDLIVASGVFGLHLLRRDQWELIWHLGLQSGRELDKLATLETRSGLSGVPMLVDAAAAFECRVINAMDAGAATFFLGEIADVREQAADEVMTSEYFRAHMPAAKRRLYEARLAHAMEYLEPLARHVETARTWTGPSSGP
ncbi:MAG TPA: flavin reductase family protein [Longimicrobiales bacterium]|nr:flavin reductase family protein [Longimicrobiales bacterium]